MQNPLESLYKILSADIILYHIVPQCYNLYDIIKNNLATPIFANYSKKVINCYFDSAVDSDDIEMVKILLTSGQIYADQEDVIIDRFSDCNEQNLDILKILIGITSTRDKYEKIFLEATINNYPNIVKLLMLDYGCDKSNLIEYALSYATRWKYPKIIRIILTYSKILHEISDVVLQDAADCIDMNYKKYN